MKKLMNASTDYVDEMLDGMVAAFPGYLRGGETGRVLQHRGAGAKGRVGIVSGGGSGHLPLFAGYVGEGLLDACSIGNVFEGPTAASCMEAIQAADGGAGVLCLYGNYGGDRMNFDMACEIMAEDGIETSTVLGRDDIASASPEEAEKRRGVAGIIYAYKIAGAKAQTGASLLEVTAAAEKAVRATRTIGVALGPCHVPGAARPSFQLGDNEIEMGMGIHGEPGIWRDQLKPADAVIDEMVARLLAESPLGRGSRTAVLLNSLGATPLEELLIAYRRVASQLGEAGVTVAHRMVGHYATSMEMAGLSLSLLALDDEMEALLAAPTDCPFWRAS